MGNTLLFNSKRNSKEFLHIEQPCLIHPIDSYTKFNDAQFIPINIEELFMDDFDSMYFFSEEPKVFITLMNGMYHFFMDTLGPFIRQYQLTPNATFIFDTCNLYPPDDKYLNFFIKVLNDKEINYRFIKSTPSTKFYAKNFYTRKYIDEGTDSPNAVYDFFADYIKNPEVKPHKKVYVSRKAMGPRPLNIIPGASFPHDNRIDNEQKLEDFFAGIGFDIIVPENFETFEDQLNYFYEVETLVSLTSGGITNASFMQPGGNVFELINTMITPVGHAPDTLDKQHFEEALHHYYVVLSWNKSHNYFGIDNKLRSADFIINRIKTDPKLKLLFGI